MILLLSLLISCNNELTDTNSAEPKVLPVEHITLAELNAIYIANGIAPLPDDYIELRKKELKTRATSFECYKASLYGDVNNSGFISAADLVHMAYKREDWDTNDDDELEYWEMDMISPQDLQDRIYEFAYIHSPDFTYTAEDSYAVQDYILGNCND